MHRLLLTEFSCNAHLCQVPCTSSFYWHRAQKEWTMAKNSGIFCVFPFVCVSLCEDHTQQPLAHSWMGGSIFARKPGPVWVPWPPYGLWEGPQRLRLLLQITFARNFVRMIFLSVKFYEIAIILFSLSNCNQVQWF